MTNDELQALPTDLLISGDYLTRAVKINGKMITANKSLQVVNHSPDGFNWGYAGSGPSQLALAILMEYFSLDDACQWYQTFKFDFVAKWPQRDFNLYLDLRAFAVKRKI